MIRTRPQLTEPEIQRRLQAVFNGGPVCKADRRWALALCGITAKEIAAEAETSTASVYQVLSGYMTTRAVRRIIAQAIGIAEERLWPEDSR